MTLSIRVMDCFCLNIFSFVKKKPKHILKRFSVSENAYTKLPKLKPVKYTRYFRAKKDHVSSVWDELSFRQGDILEVQCYNGVINYEAKNLNTNLIGSVSLSYVSPYSIYERQPWYFANVSRMSAEEILLDYSDEDGTFLVRPSMTFDHNPFALSIRCSNNEIKHYKINKGRFGYYISHGICCSTLENLIFLYQNDIAGRLGLCQRITKPCPKSNEIYANLL